MQLIIQNDIVARALFVFLWIMLIASVYMSLIKTITLGCRVCNARRFLRGLAQARSLQQVRELVDRQATIESFSRVTHHIMIEKKLRDATADRYSQESGAHKALAQRLIEEEAAEQAVSLHQGLNLLAAMVWVAPLTGLVAAVWMGLQSLPATEKSSGLWVDGVAMMQFGLVAAAISLVAYLCLLGANRMYLSQFAFFKQKVMLLLEQGANVKDHEATPRYGFSRVGQRALYFET